MGNAKHLGDLTAEGLPEHETLRALGAAQLVDSCLTVRRLLGVEVGEGYRRRAVR